MSDEIRIYVADLAAYNAGYLHGKWIDLDSDLDEIWNQIKIMLKESPVEDAEEYAIHDYEGFGNYPLSEYEGIERAIEVAQYLITHPELGPDLLTHFNGDIDEAKRAEEENYAGQYDSLEDYARELTEETSEVPEHLAFYIDYEAMGRDMELNGDVYTVEAASGDVHIFWNG
jgi:antirestriction protein